MLLNEFSEAKEYEYKALLKKVSMLPDIKEAIMVASTSLFKAISNVDSLNDKKLKSTFFSTYEYLKELLIERHHLEFFLPYIKMLIIFKKLIKKILLDMLD